MIKKKKHTQKQTVDRAVGCVWNLLEEGWLVGSQSGKEKSLLRSHEW